MSYEDSKKQLQPQEEGEEEKNEVNSISRTVNYSI
jgi:hypothetical protein